MAVKKRFPYRAALVACNGGCRTAKDGQGCADGCIGCGACIQACKLGAIFLNEYGAAEVDCLWEMRKGLSTGDYSHSRVCKLYCCKML